jgi:hypothetical protein
MTAWTSDELDEYAPESPEAQEQLVEDTAIQYEDEIVLPAEECLEFHTGDCVGPVELHAVGRATRAFPRCDYHLELRWAKEEDIIALESWGRNVDYLDAGERWDIDE